MILGLIIIYMQLSYMSISNKPQGFQLIIHIIRGHAVGNHLALKNAHVTTSLPGQVKKISNHVVCND